MIGKPLSEIEESGWTNMELSEVVNKTFTDNIEGFDFNKLVSHSLVFRKFISGLSYIYRPPVDLTRELYKDA